MLLYGTPVARRLTLSYLLTNIYNAKANTISSNAGGKLQQGRFLKALHHFYYLKTAKINFVATIFLFERQKIYFPRHSLGQ